MYEVLADYDFELNHLVQGDYVITPIKDINGKKTYWISKKGYMHAIYLRTKQSYEKESFSYYEQMFEEGIHMYETFLKQRREQNGSN